jgi:hypothetical protein
MYWTKIGHQSVIWTELVISDSHLFYTFAKLGIDKFELNQKRASKNTFASVINAAILYQIINSMYLIDEFVAHRMENRGMCSQMCLRGWRIRRRILLVLGYHHEMLCYNVWLWSSWRVRDRQISVESTRECQIISRLNILRFGPTWCASW